MTGLGLAVVGAAVASYFAMLFAWHRFSYRTWLFDAGVGVGVLLSLGGLLRAGSAVLAYSSVGLGIVWFVVSRRELKLRTSGKLVVGAGDALPRFAFATTDGKAFTDQDLRDAAPAVLTLYRGWWCPSSKAQLDELLRERTALRMSGLRIFAASVDSPEQARPMQQSVGDSVTILCNVADTFLDGLGVRDSRGAPWYDRLIFGAAKQDIAMPATFVVDKRGMIAYAVRASRVDEHPRLRDIPETLR
jgi:peroxiredoxin